MDDRELRIALDELFRQNGIQIANALRKAKAWERALIVRHFHEELQRACRWHIEKYRQERMGLKHRRPRQGDVLHRHFGQR